MDIKILVSTHKPYIMPKDVSLYLPIQVGYDEVSEHFGYQGDNICLLYTSDAADE